MCSSMSSSLRTSSISSKPGSVELVAEVALLFLALLEFKNGDGEDKVASRGGLFAFVSRATIGLTRLSDTGQLVLLGGADSAGSWRGIAIQRYAKEGKYDADMLLRRRRARKDGYR